MKKDKKKIVIIITLLLSIIITYGITKIFTDKKEKPIINEVKKDKRMAIMVQSGDGYKEYVSEDDAWPGSEYVFKKAECVDNAGNRVEDIVTFDNETRKATVKSKKTVYCTLYFDEKPKVTINILREKDSQGYLSEDLQGGMYRYQASFPECDNESVCEDATKMTNWICFGTTDNCGINEEDIDKYMYRIIGITDEGQLYLIKETFLKEGSETTFSWNDKLETSGSYPYTCDNKICPEWGQNTLFKRLNGTSNGGTQGKGSCYPTCDNATTDVFVDSEYYDYLRSGDKSNGEENASKWYNLITDNEWMYGDTIETKYNGNEMYAIETGTLATKHYVGTDGMNIEETYKWSQSVSAKISLMYMHDILYAYPGGNPESITNVANSWINFRKDGYNISSASEWISTRWGVRSKSKTSVDARRMFSSGLLDADISGNPLYFARGVRPVFYLSSKARIANGNGSKENPFILSLI